MTETRRGRTHVATRWAMAARHRAPWKWTPPAGLVASRGTAVQLTLENPLSPLLDAGFLDGVLRHHFEPILDPRFRQVLGRRYPDGVSFTIDGRPVDAANLSAMRRGGQRRLPMPGVGGRGVGALAALAEGGAPGDAAPLAVTPAEEHGFVTRFLAEWGDVRRR